MQNEHVNPQKAAPKLESQAGEQEDIWTSAFDSQNGASADPPPLDLRAGKPMQMQADGPGPKEPLMSPTQVVADAEKIHEILEGWFTDGADAVAVLRGKSIAHLRAVRACYTGTYGTALEQRMQSTLSATNFRAAMSYLWPALTLMQRLSPQKGFIDDNEEAMVAIIKTAAASEPGAIAEARSQGLRDWILTELDGMERYEMHKLAYPPVQFPGEHWSIALKTIDAGDNLFWDDDDFAYMVILDLTPQQRKQLWDKHQERLSYLSASEPQLKALLLGDEKAVVETTMDLATDGPGTYDNLAEKTVNHAADKMAREKELRSKMQAGDASVAPELNHLSGMGDLAKTSYPDGEVNPDSFLGDLEGDLDDATFREMAAKVGMDGYDQAKRMILNAVGTFDDDEQAMRDAFEMIPDEQVRRRLWTDPEVQAAFRASLNDSELLQVAAYRDGDSYRIAEDKLLKINDYWTYIDANYVELIELLVSLEEPDRTRLVAAYPGELAMWTRENTGNPELARAVAEAARTGDVSLPQVIRAASEGDGTEEELITAKLDRLSEEEYVALRMGYALKSGFQIPETIMPMPQQQVARHSYELLIAELEKEMGFDELQSTIDVFLETPSLTEMSTPGGMDMSMFIFRQRVQDKIATRNGSPSDWFIDIFSNSGGVADVAAINALSIYNQGMADGSASDVDAMKMGVGYNEYDKAYQDHVAACDTVADLGSTVAAIAVAMVVVIASQGTATGPAIAALASYLGSTGAATVVSAAAAAAAGTYKLAASELIGQEHFSVQDEGARTFMLGSVDGALAALTAGIAKSLQMSFYAALNLGEAALATEMTVGAIRGVEWTFANTLRQVGIHTTRGTIDGIMSGAVGNLVLTGADEGTWRKSVWGTVTTLGASLLQGMAMGGVTGGAAAGGIGAALSKTAKTGVAKLDDFASRVGIDLEDLSNLPFERHPMVYEISGKLAAGEAEEAETILRRLQAELGKDPATRIRKHLYVANAQPLAKTHIDDYLEQLIRRQGGPFGVEQQQWVELEGFFHGDPASLQTFIARSDEEMMYALRSAKEETLDGAHGLSRHGPDVTDAKLEDRVTTGWAADHWPSPSQYSTRFNSYKDFWETREFALQQIQAGKNHLGHPVDFRYPPGVNSNPIDATYKGLLQHPSRLNMTSGFAGAGTGTNVSIPRPGGIGVATGKTYSSLINASEPEMFRTMTTVAWDGSRWTVKQHIPWVKDFDYVSHHYTTVCHNP